MFLCVAVKRCHIRRYATGPRPLSLLSRDAFLASSQNNSRFEQLSKMVLSSHIKLIPDDHKPIDGDRINSEQTLPRTTDFKSHEDLSNVPSWRRTPTLWIRVGKKLIRLYRDSVVYTFKLHRSAPRISLPKLLQQLELGDAKSEPLPSRKSFVENAVRVKEFRKIPVFILCLIVFEELTAVLMYIWPQIAIHRCLGIKGFRKISKKFARKDMDLAKHPQYKTAYTLNRHQKLELLNSLFANKTPRWKFNLWAKFQVADKLEQEICKTLQYLIIDDSLLLKEITSEKKLALTYNELVNCILERQLYETHEDLNEMVNDPKTRQVLLWRLVSYLSFRFDGVLTPVSNISGSEGKTFTTKWGVNNVALLNYPGTTPTLIQLDHLPLLTESN
ncbi:Pnt1p KNAG_0G02770 [Huiozyma naganishii CBS 8797]|uniref:Letm1 RBD domain-containing protein n=1 Tax=Huiozyma naganishii (strain ATCC MYA-139 / BCRC 22969 / CBS 8797 / KCTC 17520 / NBRC 10181 / NCYC 3082 / Yp74L-3) TaxID=1071383 RepID=J7RNX4_HUIN7|nr:hypothetical protein KNAG_0G02770 [Kazachstania naganishii CBS 8797]CCK71333.1 hypothetical protein KNAG_0G02770 [Kazachstania naganishii CBS 8797]